MEIRDRFCVSAPIDDTWKVLLDVERIAPCLPGAQLQEVEGDVYRGLVKVKVGPITSQYKGSAHLAEVDVENRRIVIDAKGRDTRGAGDASASIVVTMSEDGPGTAVEVITELRITGKVASLGRGMLEDVSAKLLGQFVENLERDVLGARAAETATREEPGGGDVRSSVVPTGTLGVKAHDDGPGSPASEVTLRRIDAPEPDPIDLLAAAGRPMLRRLVPVGAAIVVLVLLWRLLRRLR